MTSFDRLLEIPVRAIAGHQKYRARTSSHHPIDHARVAVGTNALPLGVAAEAEGTFELL